MSLTQGLEPVTAPAAPVSNGEAGTPTSPQPDSTAHIGTPAPAAPVTQQVPGAQPEDYRTKHERLVNETMPALQSRAATAENRATKAEQDLAALREEVGNLEDIRDEIASERDTAWADQIGKWLAEGATLRQVADKVRADITRTTAQRSQSETQRQNVEGLIGIVQGYDPPYAAFLRSMAKHGTAITQETITALRPTYESFKGAGSPALAAQAATNTPGKEPPVVPQGGPPTRIGDAPAWKPGMRARDLIGQALRGSLGTGFERPPRKE